MEDTVEAAVEMLERVVLLKPAADSIWLTIEPALLLVMMPAPPRTIPLMKDLR